MPELRPSIERPRSARRSSSAAASFPQTDSNEWRKTARPKLPFAIATKDGRPFTSAGVWEGWKDPESGEWLRTCTIITGEPNEIVAWIQPRTYVSRRFYPASKWSAI
jgi:putative SOS response-associated peptidase YedK